MSLLNNYTYKIVVSPTGAVTLPAIESEANALMQTRNNWREAIDGAKKIDYIFIYCIYTYYPKKYWDIPTKVIGNIEISKTLLIGDKDVFYSAFDKFFPSQCKKFVPMQYDITEDNCLTSSPDFSNGKIWYAKLSNGWAGTGNIVLTNKDEYIAFFNSWYSKNDKKATHNINLAVKINMRKQAHIILKANEEIIKYKNTWILSEYIRNPLLINKHKFHLRVPLLYFLENGKTLKSFISTRPMIFTAEKPFRKSDWSDPQYHDTHYKRSYSKTLEFPKDLNISQEQLTRVNTQIDELASYLSIIIQKHKSTKCYENTTHCYYIWGFDVIIDENYKVWFIEINYNAVIFNENTEYRKSLLEGLFCKVVDKYFDNTDVKKDNGFFKELDLTLYYNTNGGYNDTNYHKYMKYKSKYLTLKMK